MRCKNCGWPNKPGEQVCSKCHSPLGTDDDAPGNQSPYGAAAPSSPDSGLKKTVREDVVFGGGQQHGEQPYQGTRRETPQYEDARYDEPRYEAPQRESGPSQCPKCGYPLRQGADKCPNCNYSLSQASQGRSSYSREEPAHATAQEEHRRPTRLNDAPPQSLRERPTSGGHFRGTVNPYMMDIAATPSFTLKPIKRANERHDYTEEEFEGEEVVLNRNNTEPANPSITSREQAVVTHRDGHWYIEDHSEQRTTFVQAAHPTELHDGDLILLGNRLFEFHK